MKQMTVTTRNGYFDPLIKKDINAYHEQHHNLLQTYPDDVYISYGDWVSMNELVDDLSPYWMRQYLIDAFLDACDVLDLPNLDAYIFFPPNSTDYYHSELLLSLYDMNIIDQMLGSVEYPQARLFLNKLKELHDETTDDRL